MMNNDARRAGYEHACIDLDWQIAQHAGMTLDRVRAIRASSPDGYYRILRDEMREAWAAADAADASDAADAADAKNANDAASAAGSAPEGAWEAGAWADDEWADDDTLIPRQINATALAVSFAGCVVAALLLWGAVDILLRAGKFLMGAAA